MLHNSGQYDKFWEEMQTNKSDSQIKELTVNLNNIFYWWIFYKLSDRKTENIIKTTTAKFKIVNSVFDVLVPIWWYWLDVLERCCSIKKMYRLKDNEYTGGGLKINNIIWERYFQVAKSTCFSHWHVRVLPSSFQKACK